MSEKEFCIFMYVCKWFFGEDSSFVPPLIYAMLGSSRDLAVGTVAVPSLLISSILTKEVNPHHNPKLYVQLVLTATFFAGVFQAALGLLRSAILHVYTHLHVCVCVCVCLVKVARLCQWYQTIRPLYNEFQENLQSHE